MTLTVGEGGDDTPVRGQQVSQMCHLLRDTSNGGLCLWGDPCTLLSVFL